MFYPPENRLPFAAEIDELPCADAIRQNPDQLLRVALASTLAGGRRARLDCALPAKGIRDGEIVVEDVVARYRPPIFASHLDELVNEPVWGQESTDHRRLKLHARLLARAIDPLSDLGPEAILGPERSAKRVDLLAVSGAGVLTAYECGSVDGRKICRLFHDGVARIIVLPFAGLKDPLFVRGWCFSLAGTSPLLGLTPETLRSAWAHLLHADNGPSSPDF